MYLAELTAAITIGGLLSMVLLGMIGCNKWVAISAISFCIACWALLLRATS